MTTLNTIILHQPYSNPHFAHIKHNLLQPSFPTRYLVLKKNISITTREHCFVPRCVQKPSDHNNKPNMASKGLYASIMNQNLREFFEKMENERQILRHIPLTLVLQSLVKQQGAVMLSSLMAFIVDGLEFVVKPTAEGGPDVGIGWTFAWRTRDIPLGPVSRINISHLYKGKIILRNGMSLIEPLINMELLKAKMKEFVTHVSEKIIPNTNLPEKRKAALLNCFLGLLFMAISLVLLKNIFV